jgi:putative SOS response-associated peptidase YedK
VLITPSQFALWLSGDGGTEMLKPAPNDSVRSWQVSSRVNATGKNDDKSLIENVAY